MLSEVRDKGWINNYQGVKISSQGRRFSIDNTIVWNIVDDQGNYHGQGTTFQESIMLSFYRVMRHSLPLFLAGRFQSRE